MTEAQTLAYVMAAAAALDLPLQAGRAERVAAHLQQTALFAAMLDEFLLTPEQEFAQIYDPSSVALPSSILPRQS